MPSLSLCTAFMQPSIPVRHRRTSSARRAASVRPSGKVIGTSQGRQHHSGPPRGLSVLIEPCFSVLALALVSLVFPEAASASSVTVMDVTGYLLSHPFWTLVGASTLVVVIPRIIKVRPFLTLGPYAVCEGCQ